MIRHPLLPFLGPPFGRGTRLGNVVFGVNGHARTAAVDPYVDPPLALPYEASGADRPGLLANVHEHHTLADFSKLLNHELQLLVATAPVLPRATNRRHTLERGVVDSSDTVWSSSFFDTARPSTRPAAVVGRVSPLGHPKTSRGPANALARRPRRRLDGVPPPRRGTAGFGSTRPGR
jgi:hypothetical protein